MNKRILVLTTYPIRKSIHGGQRRSKAMVDAYKRAGCDVVVSAVFNPPAYSHADERGRYDIAAPEKTLELISKTPVLEDVILGQSCYDDPQVRMHIENLIANFKPDFIDFEQPYLYLGVEKILDKLPNRPKVIFSSHNVEYKMKQKIYEGHADQLTEDEVVSNVALIKAVETALCKDAAITIAVSESDMQEHKRMGAKNIELIPNGIEDISTTEEHIKKWKEFFAKNGILKPILFTGSAHPPNWTGFMEMMGTRLGFLPITSKLMIVGDIGSALEYVISKTDQVYGSSFWLRAYNCKRLSDHDLSALITLCDTIILPITEGGGSNLKTAEAINSGKKIVASKHAMRGYDEFLNLPNVFVEDSPEDFKKRLKVAVDAGPIDLTDKQKRFTKTVLWQARTEKLEQMIREL